MKQAERREALVLITGDLFDAMAGRSDPRASKTNLRSEYKCDRWLDRIVEDCAQWFERYSRNLFLVSDGNHETSIRKRLEIDLCQRFCGIINTMPGTKTYYGHYAGTVRHKFMEHRGVPIDTRGLNYHHGTGYGARYKRIERAGEYPDSYILTFGHHHKCESEKVHRTRVSSRGVVYDDEQILLVCPSVKNEHGKGSKGWAVEEGHRGKPTGAMWLRWFYSRAQERFLADYFPAQVI